MCMGHAKVYDRELSVPEENTNPLEYTVPEELNDYPIIGEAGSDQEELDGYIVVIDGIEYVFLIEKAESQ